jgi:hypothetical protein
VPSARPGLHDAKPERTQAAVAVLAHGFEERNQPHLPRDHARDLQGDGLVLCSDDLDVPPCGTCRARNCGLTFLLWRAACIEDCARTMAHVGSRAAPVVAFLRGRHAACRRGPADGRPRRVLASGQSDSPDRHGSVGAMPAQLDLATCVSETRCDAAVRYTTRTGRVITTTVSDAFPYEFRHRRGTLTTIQLRV